MMVNLEKIRNLLDSDIICYCNNITKGVIIDAINKGADSLEELQKMTNAGTGKRCKELNPNRRCCYPELEALLQIYGKSEKDNLSDSCCKL